MDLCRLQENGMYAILTILWCVHDSNLDSALQLPFILHVIMSQNLPEMCFLFLSLVKSGSIFRDAELVSLGGWLSKRMYKRSKIMVKSISILIWSQLTPSYLLSVCRLRMHSDLGPSFQVIGHHKSVFNILVQITCVFFLHLVQSDQVGPGTMCAVTLIKVQQYFFQYKSFPLGTFYFILNVLNFS